MLVAQTARLQLTLIVRVPHGPIFILAHCDRGAVCRIFEKEAGNQFVAVDPDDGLQKLRWRLEILLPAWTYEKAIYEICKTLRPSHFYYFTDD